MKIDELLKKPPVWIAGVLLVIILVLGIFGFMRYREISGELARIKSDPQAAQEFTQKEQDQLLTKIGTLIELPSDERPTIAQVTDVDRLRDQPFFANAQNGDRVLIYPNARKAILYRPETNKIIDVAPVNIGPTATASAGSAQAASANANTTTTAQAASVVLRNGTNTVGLTRTYEEELKQKDPSLVVTNRDNAKKRDYEKTLLVDVKRDKTALAEELARKLGIDTGTLPEGEATPTADFLIIIGEDRK